MCIVENLLINMKKQTQFNVMQKPFSFYVTFPSDKKTLSKLGKKLEKTYPVSLNAFVSFELTISWLEVTENGSCILQLFLSAESVIIQIPTLCDPLCVCFCLWLCCFDHFQNTFRPFVCLTPSYELSIVFFGSNLVLFYWVSDLISWCGE